MGYSFTVVHRTEVVKKNLNPQWRPFTLKARVLCAGDYDRLYALLHQRCSIIASFSFLFIL